MNKYHVTIIYLIAASVFCSADAQERDWHPSTSILDETAKYADPDMMDAAGTLARDLKKFYQLLREKKWHETYELRAKAFREVVRESDYLAEAKKAGKLWGLANYNVLSAKFQNAYGSTNIDEAVLICKFTELPGYGVTYSTVYWHKEDGVWKCLSAGPGKLSIFRETVTNR